MKVIFKQTILDKLNEAINIAIASGKEIEKIEVTNQEFQELKHNFRQFVCNADSNDTSSAITAIVYRFMGIPVEVKC